MTALKKIKKEKKKSLKKIQHVTPEVPLAFRYPDIRTGSLKVNY